MGFVLYLNFSVEGLSDEGQSMGFTLASLRAGFSGIVRKFREAVSVVGDVLKVLDDMSSVRGGLQQRVG